MIKTNIDFSSVYDMLDDLGSGNMWNYAAQRLKALVMLLINKGVDVNGRVYKPYKQSYINFRTKKGLGTRVNLQLTSEMVLSIVARNSSGGFEIFITGASNNQKARWVSRDRHFLEWGHKTERELMKAINDYFRMKGYL